MWQYSCDSFARVIAAKFINISSLLILLPGVIRPELKLNEQKVEDMLIVPLYRNCLLQAVRLILKGQNLGMPTVFKIWLARFTLS